MEWFLVFVPSLGSHNLIFLNPFDLVEENMEKALRIPTQPVVQSW